MLLFTGRTFSLTLYFDRWCTISSTSKNCRNNFINFNPHLSRMKSDEKILCCIHLVPYFYNNGITHNWLTNNQPFITRMKFKFSTWLYCWTRFVNIGKGVLVDWSSVFFFLWLHDVMCGFDLQVSILVTISLHFCLQVSKIYQNIQL